MSIYTGTSTLVYYIYVSTCVRLYISTGLLMRLCDYRINNIYVYIYILSCRYNNVLLKRVSLGGI